MNDWLNKGYARSLGFHELTNGFFIPTFMVVREDKSTTKFRLIVNGKFEFEGRSINDYLLSGPNVMNRLADVLLRFRYHKYVLTCDIANMFLRVKVPEKDRKYLRFFHRDEKGQIVVIEMCSHAFGLTQSPFVVINTVKEKAAAMASDLPKAYKAVDKDSIVDDILTGCKTYEGLERLQQEIVQLYGKMQMQAHKWATNSPSLREKLPQASKEPIDLGKEGQDILDASSHPPSVKCLGILWHPADDRLQFFGTQEDVSRPLTMREISSLASRLFDPLGLMTPLLLEAKLLLQSLWKLKTGWDEPVPEKIESAFLRWLRKTQKAHLSSIPRRVKASIPTQQEILVIFTDASSQAQAAAAYLWCEGEERGEGNLWASKQRISSLNRADSISRLELEGALTGVELARQICCAMHWDMSKVLYFTDSTTVLWWLRTHRELEVFVGNRVCKILELSSLKQWYHVRTDQNPADIPTRGMSGRKLAECELWWKGPKFFRQSRTDWPEQPDVVETRESKEGYRKEETRRLERWLCYTKLVEPERDRRTNWRDEFWLGIVNRYSDLSKGFRVAAVVFRWLGKMSRFGYSSTRKMSVRKIQQSVLKAVQGKELGTLKLSLKKNKKLEKEYEGLRPYIDEEGLIRIGGEAKKRI